jgi:hypothetical protein
MAKSDIREIQSLMKRYDPLLVAAAVGDEGVESGIVAEEVANIKAAFKKFDRKAVARAVADYIGDNSVVFSCGGPVCTCPEDGGCGAYTIRVDLDNSVYRLGISMSEAIAAIDNPAQASAVIGNGDLLGYAGLCIDTVKCHGQQIFVMNRCRASLYAFDLGEGLIDPVNAMAAIAKPYPALSKRVNAMLKEMEKAGELPG